MNRNTRFDRSRTPSAKAGTLTRRGERRAKSARLFLELAFGDDVPGRRFAR
jgi:hypothetical protein